MEAGTLIAAFVIGLLGGVHCMGMCGGIVGALTLGIRGPVPGERARPAPFLLAYNLGRMTSYTLAGALAGGVGWFAAHLADVNQAQQVLQVLAGLFMIALGLYLAGWWHGLVYLERAGGLLWRRLEPLGRRVMPVRSPAQALGLGLVWGWLPCGLVYSVLFWSLAAGGAAQGAALMLAFGVGTLPNLLLMGVFAARLATVVQKAWVRGLAGAAVAGYGIYMLLVTW
ncbi:sulfite exporter TauE/SafE family protein [Ectothiorhodospira shaposhnikovii]|uniref:sulfite exporter TauE/SafE family protein n=1 Tax=Ectothiorhodospira shaposhnikovii TaxID=1054 RepID=UPI001EE8449D|nr:sulfite exporter TauE/SafE family protein [Ectothiorhodospira shaposhnikovii]MCG5512297.1 sulfite exporter TauE/SafE family protein [Ectothiorhodospira shaposhnikovii]